MGTRDETVLDLFFVDLTSQGSPTEEGQTRRVGNDLVAMLGGQVKSLTSGALPTPIGPDVFLYSEDGLSWLQVTPLVGDGWLFDNNGRPLYVG